MKMSLKKTAVSLALVFSLVNAVQAREINPLETVNEPQAEIVEKEVMTSKVINLDIKVENDNNYIVTAMGTLKNNSHLLVRDAYVKVVLMDRQRNILLEVPVNEAINLGPNEEKPFKVSKFVRTNKSPFSIRGQAEVARSET